MPTLSASGVSQSQASSDPDSANESPIGRTSIIAGSQHPGSAVSSTQPQPSDIVGPSSISKANEATSSGESNESASALQASRSSESMFTSQNSGPGVPESGALSTAEPRAAPLGETRYQPSNTNEPGMQTTSQTMSMVSQSMGSSQGSDGQLPETTPIPSQASGATRGSISTQNLGETASQLEPSTTTASQSFPVGSLSQQSQFASDSSGLAESTQADTSSPSRTQQVHGKSSLPR